MSGIRSACVVTLLATVATLAYSPRASAQNAYCVSCVTQRWQSLEKIMLARAQRLKTARVLLRDAKRRGDAELVRTAETHLANITRLWEEANATAKALGSPSYKAHLARNLVEVEGAYDAAYADWKKKLAMFDRLRGTLAGQRAGLEAEIEGILKEEKDQRRRMAVNGMFTLLKARSAWAEEQVRHLRSLPNGAVEHATTLQGLNRFIGAQRSADASKALYEQHEGHYWEAGAEAGELALDMLVPAASRLHPAVVVTGPIAKLGLDLAAVGLSHVHWRQAQVRLEDLRNTETKWQLNIAIMAARVENLKNEREMVAQTIDRQKFFERQFATIRADMVP